MELPERYEGNISTGIPVTLSVTSEAHSVKGEIVAVNPKIDQANRTFLIKVAVNNRDGKLVSTNTANKTSLNSPAMLHQKLLQYLCLRDKESVPVNK